MSDKRQKNQLVLAFAEESRSEAPRDSVGGTETLMAKREAESKANREQLMAAACERKNCEQALARVKSNKGVAGIDGMTVEQLPAYLKQHWPTIREQLLSGSYKPQPVKRVEIPKPDGGMRQLGIPTVLDRFIQQAVMQVLQRSLGPNLLSTQKFFDRVNHDKLMAKLARRISDKRLLKLIRAFLRAGVMEGGLVSPVDEGTPQGGPLSPLLSNIVLDELDQELARRGHRFVRYADDCNIYVRSQRAGSE
jgi:RNA-directed DNA polymerase